MSSLNPFTILDSILEDYASPRTRRLVHSLILLVVAVVAIWMAAQGDWKKMLVAIGAAVYAEANRANTDPDAGAADGVGFYDGEGDESEDDSVSGNTAPLD